MYVCVYVCMYVCLTGFVSLSRVRSFLQAPATQASNLHDLWTEFSACLERRLLKRRIIVSFSLSIRPSYGAREEEILDGGGGRGRRERFLSFTSLPFSLPFFPFSPETPDTQAMSHYAFWQVELMLESNQLIWVELNCSKRRTIHAPISKLIGSNRRLTLDVCPRPKTELGIRFQSCSVAYFDQVALFSNFNRLFELLGSGFAPYSSNAFYILE